MNAFREYIHNIRTHLADVPLLTRLIIFAILGAFLTFVAFIIHMQIIGVSRILGVSVGLGALFWAPFALAFALNGPSARWHNETLQKVMNIVAWVLIIVGLYTYFTQGI